MIDRKRIVLVEDDDGIRAIAQISLESVGGHQVLAFARGEDALTGAPAFRPDLLVLDVSMPGLDGPATLLRMRAEPALAAVPAVFLTANTQAAQVSAYRELGALDIIAKPFDPAQLCERIAAVLSRAGRDAGAAAHGDSRPAALVVEDDGGIRLLLRFILEQQGWRVHELASGSAALEHLRDGDVPDAVLLDIMLPGVDGLQLLSHLRDDPRWSSVPVMMLTAKGDEASVRRALAAGASDYVSKPFDPADLAQRLQRLRAHPAPTSSP